MTGSLPQPSFAVTDSPGLALRSLEFPRSPEFPRARMAADPPGSPAVWHALFRRPGLKGAGEGGPAAGAWWPPPRDGVNSARTPPDRVTYKQPSLGPPAGETTPTSLPAPRAQRPVLRRPLGLGARQEASRDSRSQGRYVSAQKCLWENQGRWEGRKSERP